MPPKKQSIAKMAKPHASRPYMPGYGLPKGAKGLLPWTWAERLLNKSHNYWIATSRPDGAPHVMVVWALWLDGAIYFSTGSKSRKAKNLDRNPKCVICRSEEHTSELQSRGHLVCRLLLEKKK